MTARLLGDAENYDVPTSTRKVHRVATFKPCFVVEHLFPAR
jgi:hypothetical protein